MKAVGIICEYNPFHNGHLYHLEMVKNLYPNHIIILVMSGNFLQRGEVSIINKWDKTKIALEHNIDLVVELPFVFATQGADIFAHGAIEILNKLDVEYIVFGSEIGDIDVLKTQALIQLNNNKYDNLVKKYLDEGINYPTALSKALKELGGVNINNPNDILGLCYIKEIIKQKSNIKPITIKRTNNYHDLTLNDICSASSIRNALKNRIDVKNYVPDITYSYLQYDLHFIDNYFKILKYKILTEKDLSIYQTVDEGIENRLKKYIIECNSLDEFIEKVKTKRYTNNKIRRMLTHILCNFTKKEALENKNIKYIRVLGFNKNGQKYLNKIKKELDIPIITKYNDLLSIEFRSTCIYSNIFNNNKLIEQEYKNKPIIK